MADGAKVLPVNRKFKDRLFQKIYESEENLKELAHFLLGIKAEEVRISNVEPVIFGNKENDLAFLCNDSLYIMMEEQSYDCANVAYRILEYIVAALRSTVESEKLLYGEKKVMFPMPKLYVVNVGLVKSGAKLKGVQYDMRLSDSYMNKEKMDEYGVDLECMVHVYDFRMTYEETFTYIDKNEIPVRLSGIHGSLSNYGLTANCLTYVQKGMGDGTMVEMPEGIRNTADMIQRLKDRGIFVDLFSDKEVCDMTIAQFSRDDILMYRGREEGRDLEVFSSVQEGDYSIERGAQKLNLSVQEFEQRMKEAGFKIPFVFKK